MTVGSVMQVGISGVQRGLNGMRRAAQDVAELNLNDRSTQGVVSDENASRAERSPSDVKDLTQALTDLQYHKRQVQASTKVIEAADEMVGFLLDVTA